MGLKDMELDSATVSNLTPTQLASVLSGYLVSYDDSILKEYCDMKRRLLKYVKDILLSGAVLVQADKCIFRKQMHEMIEVICENVHTPAPSKHDSMEVPLSSFME